MKVIYKPNLKTMEEGDTLPQYLTEGKIYTVEKLPTHNYYMMKCDDGEMRYLYKEDFILVNKYREEQINKIMDPILTESDYNQALKRLDEIFDAKPNTKEGEELLHLANLIEEWENKNYPIN